MFKLFFSFVFSALCISIVYSQGQPTKSNHGNKFEQNDSYLQVSINKIENGNGEYDK